jgi:hypothetical protein
MLLRVGKTPQGTANWLDEGKRPHFLYFLNEVVGTHAWTSDKLVSHCYYILSARGTRCVRVQAKEMVLSNSRRSSKYKKLPKSALANSHQFQHATEAPLDWYTIAGKTETYITHNLNLVLELFSTLQLQNNLMELWSLLHFLMPYIFRSRKEFSYWFSNPMNNIIEGNISRNDDLINRLHGIIRPFILRRLKKDVETQMPKKYEHIIKCQLSKRQVSVRSRCAER